MLLDRKTTYTVDYPKALEFVDTQMGILWLPDEIKVEKDVQDILVNMTEAERHGVITTLKLFTMYELIVGGEYWQNVVFNEFHHPADIQRMAKCFSFMELCVHAPFYSKINEVLGLANDKFYTEYLDDRSLKERIDFLNSYTDANDHTLQEALLALAFAEGVILYSNFAFLKHFQSQGKNKLGNIVRGINMSARDEALHSEASAWLLRTLLSEYPAYDVPALAEEARKMAKVVYEHECAIIDKIFEKGKIDDITDVQMKHFVESRINLVLSNLGFEKMFDVKYNPIGEWFYNGINNYIANDFFAGQGREYRRDWEEQAFTW